MVFYIVQGVYIHILQKSFVSLEELQKLPDMFCVHLGTSPLPPSGNRYGGYPQRQPFPNVYKPASYATKHYNARGIPEFDVSESYLTNNKQWQQPSSAPSSTKSNRRKFAPSFLLRSKKKTHDPIRRNYVNVDIEEEDETDIARFEDFDQQSMDSVMIGHLDDNQLNTASDENFENVYQRRIEFILSHYQQPPPYPGRNNRTDGFQGSLLRASSTPHLENDVDAPLLRQLLKDKQLTDNASMINFWQAGPPQNERAGKGSDKLVTRTQNVPNSMQNASNNPKELFEKRKQHYNLLTISENSQQTNVTLNKNNRDAVSEIIYPTNDYEGNNLRSQAMNLSASVPNLSMQYTDNMANPGTFTVPRKPRGMYCTATVMFTACFLFVYK